MTSVFFSKVFSNKNVTKVSAAICAFNLRPHAIRVWSSLNGARYLLVKAWPPAVSFKLAFRTIKFSAATFADVGSFVPKCKVFARVRRFRAFVYDDAFFLWGEFFVLLRSSQKIAN